MAMKYTAILADDEKKLIQLIKHLGNWDELGIEIIDECQDGETALESILKHRPDFVISDIKMPGYDGIELIQKCREQGLDTLFVLLSGYRYFEYARSAIQLNVVDYLLKPIDQEQLCETLKKLCETIDQTRQKTQDSARLQAYEDKQSKSNLEAFWKEAEEQSQRKEPFLSSAQIQEQYGVSFPHDAYLMCCISVSLNDDLLSDTSMYREKLETIVHHVFEGNAYVLCTHNRHGSMLVINYEYGKLREMKELISSMFYQIRDLNEIYGEFRVSIGYSTERRRPEDLSEIFHESLVAVMGRMVYSGSRIMEYKQISALSMFSPEELFSEQDGQDLLSALQYLREDKLTEVFRRIDGRIEEYREGNPDSIIQIISRIYDIIAEATLNIDEPVRLALINDFYFAILTASSYAKLFRKFHSIFLEYIEESKQKLEVKLSKPIEEAVRYLNENYGSSISLEEVAEKAGVSSVYLSRIFKEKTGLGFNEYLTQLRLEKSQKLLAKTNLSVKEIASKVGYPDEKYYSKLFKKTYGIKPTEYRKLYG